MTNQEWVVQRHRQDWPQDTMQRQNKTKTQKTKKMRNTDPAKKPTNKRGRTQMLPKDKQFCLIKDSYSQSGNKRSH